MLCTGFLANAQTQRIAFKSHSGSMSFYVPSEEDNFGIYIPPYIEPDSIILLSDTSLIEVRLSDRPGRRVYKIPRDTIYKGNFNIETLFTHYFDSLVDTDSLRQLHPGAVVIDRKGAKPGEKKPDKEPRDKSKMEVIPPLVDNNQPGGGSHKPSFIVVFAGLTLLLTLIITASLLRRLKTLAAT